MASSQTNILETDDRNCTAEEKQAAVEAIRERMTSRHAQYLTLGGPGVYFFEVDDDKTPGWPGSLIGPLQVTNASETQTRCLEYLKERGWGSTPELEQDPSVMRFFYTVNSVPNKVTMFCNYSKGGRTHQIVLTLTLRDESNASSD